MLATNGANALLERAALLHLRNHKVIALLPITLEAEYGFQLIAFHGAGMRAREPPGQAATQSCGAFPRFHKATLALSGIQPLALSLMFFSHGKALILKRLERPGCDSLRFPNEAGQLRRDVGGNGQLHSFNTRQRVRTAQLRRHIL